MTSERRGMTSQERRPPDWSQAAKVRGNTMYVRTMYDLELG